MDIAEIKAWRAKHGLTQAAAAQAIGVGVDTWRGWEGGRHIPQYPKLIRMAMNAYGNNITESSIKTT